MTKLKQLRPLLLITKEHNICRFLSKTPEDDKEGRRSSASSKAPDSNIPRPMYNPDDISDSDTNPLTLDSIVEPTNCCMSGCPNCVWIEYAEKLSLVLKNSPGDVQKIIMDKVQDQNMRAFLSMELRIRKLID